MRNLHRKVAIVAGARVLATAAKLLKEHGGGRCLVSVCTAGGMGTAATIEG